MTEPTALTGTNLSHSEYSFTAEIAAATEESSTAITCFSEGSSDIGSKTRRSSETDDNATTGYSCYNTGTSDTMPRLQEAEKFGRASTESLLEKAEEVVQSELGRCSLFQNSQALEDIPTFEGTEISVGRVVGRGGFCVVNELTALKLKGQKKRTSKRGRAIDDQAAPLQDVTSREYLSRRLWSQSGKYVVKQLNPNLLENDRVSYLKGMIDLTLEMHFLANLQHLHIMDVRGYRKESPYSEVGFFLILDQLEETLSKRLTQWMHVKRTTKGVTGFITGSKRKSQKLLIDRLLVAHDIAEGMEYLHSKRVIFRDLKPDNIGFDSENTVKIFDFGLAKELQEDERGDDGLYLMTGFTGAVRYMAPEVGLRKAYDLSADVYSWSMILWYILALEPPFGFYTPNMFLDRVFQAGYRPAVKDKWGDNLNNLMKQSWSEDIRDRPHFSRIRKILRKEAQSLDPATANFFAMDNSSGGKNFSNASNN